MLTKKSKQQQQHTQYKQKQKREYSSLFILNVLYKKKE
jgi:hypothetical protein